ncbi:YciI family protein [Algibacter sp. Ld11]|uniref:YciI family protein n=1 Tax=Algibacter sp. Ld11 TaxID=649150 RepID=UPI003867FA01
MKKLILPFLCIFLLVSCKNETKQGDSNSNELGTAVKDTVIVEVPKVPIEKTIKEIKEALTAKGFKTFEYVDETTKDTILMQQYFMAFLKRSAIKMQNEEESERLQKLHMEHLSKMHELGYADISGPFGDDGDISGVTIYNVPTLKMADSLAKSDPMVQAGRLEIEIHPWWAAKGIGLR